MIKSKSCLKRQKSCHATENMAEDILHISHELYIRPFEDRWMHESLRCLGDSRFNENIPSTILCSNETLKRRNITGDEESIMCRWKGDKTGQPSNLSMISIPRDCNGVIHYEYLEQRYGPTVIARWRTVSIRSFKSSNFGPSK